MAFWALLWLADRRGMERAWGWCLVTPGRVEVPFAYALGKLLNAEC